MSTAHRPTWNPKKGGGGLRDGVSAPPTLQSSAKDQVSHRRLKYRRADEPAVDEYAEFYGSQVEYLEDGQLAPELETDNLSDSSSEEGTKEKELLQSGEDSDSEEDEAALLAELEKIRAERAAIKATERRAVGASSAPRPASDGMLLSRGWEEEGVIFRKRTRGEGSAKSQTGVKSFINDTVRSDYHRSFIDRYVK